ncbi:unnamed protein product [Arabidopsis thaliana]|uniref:(thale cress) hypothetical protein n=1 Tax=Arabidopsis thaliana TaxID=3702 RepID=A0A7G2DWA0_ARATH|nr:unnamed protein product [Arabidopsis thaliana]
MPIKVLSSLDVARTQWYHFKAIIVAGMGLFTDAYDLFCIAPVMKMISHVYYNGDSINTAVLSTSYAIALLGTATAPLVVAFPCAPLVGLVLWLASVFSGSFLV